MRNRENAEKEKGAMRLILFSCLTVQEIMTELREVISPLSPNHILNTDTEPHNTHES